MMFGRRYGKSKALKEQAEKLEKQGQNVIIYRNICDACGKYPKQPNSMLCKECEEKANENLPTKRHAHKRK